MKDYLIQIAAILAAHEKRVDSIKPLKERRARLRKLIIKHQSALGKLDQQLVRKVDAISAKNPFHFSGYLQPIVDAVLARLPGMEVHVSGPCGLGNTTTITIVDPLKPQGDRNERSLSFRRNTSTELLVYIDYSVNSQVYPEDSIGAISGLNFLEVEISPNMNVDDLISKFR